MCSDGLTNMVSEEEIYQIHLKKIQKEAANKLSYASKQSRWI